jgi:hypothetical protein
LRRAERRHETRQRRHDREDHDDARVDERIERLDVDEQGANVRMAIAENAGLFPSARSAGLILTMALSGN